VGPRASLDTEARGKNHLCLYCASNPGRPVVQFVARHYSLLTELPRFIISRAICVAHLILLNLITAVIFGIAVLITYKAPDYVTFSSSSLFHIAYVKYRPRAFFSQAS
jgi:hypothetical protein